MMRKAKKKKRKKGKKKEDTTHIRTKKEQQQKKPPDRKEGKKRRENLWKRRELRGKTGVLREDEISSSSSLKLCIKNSPLPKKKLKK